MLDIISVQLSYLHHNRSQWSPLWSLIFTGLSLQQQQESIGMQHRLGELEAGCPASQIIAIWNVKLSLIDGMRSSVSHGKPEVELQLWRFTWVHPYAGTSNQEETQRQTQNLGLPKDPSE